MSIRFGSRGYVAALVALILILFALFSVLAPDTFPTVRNLQSMAGQMAPIGILALCIGLTFLIGGIDLSIVAVATAAGTAVALVGKALAPAIGDTPATVIGMGAAILVGVVAGLINGSLVAYLRVHPIVITLGTLTLFTGITKGITGGATVFGLANLGFMEASAFWLFLALTVVLAIVTTCSRFGFLMYTLGESEKVSRFTSMSVPRIQVVTYLISGVIAAIAGIVMFGSMNAMNVSFGSSYLIQAILVAVLSGIDAYGGKGRIALVALAVIAMQEVQTGINLTLSSWSGVNFAAQFGWGVLLIIVLALGQRFGRGGTRIAGWRFWRQPRPMKPSAGA